MSSRTAIAVELVLDPNLSDADVVCSGGAMAFELLRHSLFEGEVREVAAATSIVDTETRTRRNPDRIRRGAQLFVLFMVAMVDC
jgi:hypothetical protein